MSAERDYSGEEHQEDNQNYEQNRTPWLPPGADACGDQVLFGQDMEEHFLVPRRLSSKANSLIEAVNDFHFAMINDHDRNEFFKRSLEKVVTPDSIVLEIGTGSGLLAMIAASLGAKHVIAIEANRDMANVARRNIEANKLSDKITVINKLSTEVTLADLPRPADVLVCEILGTLLLGESALEYVHDAKMRLMAPNAAYIPSAGKQFAVVVESPDVESITAVTGWGGFDLRQVNELQDTASVVFTKQYGFRFGDCDHKFLSESVPVVDVDFSEDAPGFLGEEKAFRIKGLADGTGHAILMYWEAYGDADRNIVMSTAPSATRDNFPRDMQWGQALQLLEDYSVEADGPVPVHVSAGGEMELVCRYSRDGVVMQFELRR